MTAQYQTGRTRMEKRDRIRQTGSSGSLIARALGPIARRIPYVADDLTPVIGRIGSALKKPIVSVRNNIKSALGMGGTQAGLLGAGSGFALRGVLFENSGPLGLSPAMLIGGAGILTAFGVGSGAIPVEMLTSPVGLIGGAGVVIGSLLIAR